MERDENLQHKGKDEKNLGNDINSKTPPPEAKRGGQQGLVRQTPPYHAANRAHVAGEQRVGREGGDGVEGGGGAEVDEGEEDRHDEGEEDGES